MSSWFNLDAIEDLKSKVQAAIPIDSEMLEKLTLTTPELTAERERIDEEELRKERVRDSLSGMLPWETRDAERDILVEECKEAILALSSKEETFTGPYALPKPMQEEHEEEDDDDGADENKIPYQAPSEESLAKLSKLEPLPPLLGEFDLDAHVGLIQRLLEVDPKLVVMQSTLSGGGEKEKTFWHNYFFHCAWTRYEAGLSIDEIWSDQPQAKTRFKTNEEATEDSVSDEITFEPVEAVEPSNKEGATTETLFSAPVEVEDTTDSDLGGPPGAMVSDQSNGIDGMSATDFELVPGADDDSNSEYNSEMDELEAEIARELED